MDDSRMDVNKAAVIGAAGRVGLPTALALAGAGWSVLGIDLDAARRAQISSGIMPFHEEGGQEMLTAALTNGRLVMTGSLHGLPTARCIVIMVGTSLDERRRPVLDGLYALVDDLASYLRPGHLVVLRSTTTPGSADRIRRRLEEMSGLFEGRDFDLIYAPERAVEGRVIAEMADLPQIIGAYSAESYRLGAEFFASFASGESVMLTPTEAEMGKLMVNTARYVAIALANEFYLLGNRHGVNVNRIIDACSYRYPRFSLPQPGPNVGGPCLSKDGWYLLEQPRYAEPGLIAAAYGINEDMLRQVADLLERCGCIRRVGILGLTFKADSDDLRDSQSGKMQGLLEGKGWDCVAVDPKLADGGSRPESEADLRGCDAVVLMTPHQEFKDLRRIMDLVDNPDCVYVDIWGFWDEMRHASANGVFRGAQAQRRSSDD